MKIKVPNKRELQAAKRIMASKLDVIGYTPSKNLDKKFLKNRVYIAKADNEVVGVITFFIESSNMEITEIAAKYEGWGIGTALIDYVINKCKEESISKLWCWSLKQYNAEGFYAKMGFEERILLQKHWFNQDCWIFAKVIK